MLADGVTRTRTNSYIYATNTVSFTLYNDATGAPYNYFYVINNGAHGPAPALTPTSPFFSVWLNFDPGGAWLGQVSPTYPLNNCGAWSTYNASTSSVPSVSLLVAVVDSSGATNQYGGYTQVSETIPVHTYKAAYEDGNGYWWTFDWAQKIIRRYTVPLPTKMTNAVGYVTSLTYDSNNRLTSIRTPAGLTSTNRYDATGFLTNTVDLQIGRTNSFTYTNGLVYVWQTERGLRVTNTWDKLQRLVSRADVDGVISNVYTRLDLTAARDKLGKWTYFGYDPLRHLVAITNANQEVTLASYCSCGSLEWTRDPLNNYTYYNYDLAGRLTLVTYPDGYTISNVFNALDQVVRTTDGIGTITNIYNLQGMPIVLADAGGIISSNSFDILDRPQAMTDARGITTALTFDAVNRVLTNIVAGVSTNSFVYSTNGLIQAMDALRTNSTWFKNDVLGRHLFCTNANSEVTQFLFDPSGNLTNLVDGRLQTTVFQFDAFNRLTNKLDNSSASMLKLTYDANGWLKTRWTPEKGTTTFIPDAVGRVRTNVYPSNPQVVFSYDGNGRLTTLVDSLGVTAFTYSPAGQSQNEDGPWANDTVSRVYDHRLRSSLTLNSQTTTYGYDSAYRLTNIISSAGAFGYQYHSGFGGNYSSPLWRKLSLPQGMSITNGFDTAGRLTSTRLLNSTLAVLNAHAYGYNAANRLTSQTRYDNSSIAYTYDRIGQLKTANAQEPNATARLNEQFGYAYDSAGNLGFRTNNTLTLAFGVNSLNQLTNATRAGMLTAAGATAQAANSVE